MYIVLWKRKGQRNWTCWPTPYKLRLDADTRADEIGKRPRHMTSVQYVEEPLI